MTRTRITVHLSYDPPPIPVRDCDWQGHIDGEEERTSMSGPTPEAVLREIADFLEEEA